MREYTEQHYLPAAAAYQLRVADKGAISRKIVDCQQALEQKWSALHFGEVKVETRAGQHIFEVWVNLSDLDPKEIRVELYADGLSGENPVRQRMKPVRRLADTSNGYAYAAVIPAIRPMTDYTARAISRCGGISDPLEDARILWQH